LETTALRSLEWERAWSLETRPSPRVTVPILVALCRTVWAHVGNSTQKIWSLANRSRVSIRVRRNSARYAAFSDRGVVSTYKLSSPLVWSPPKSCLLSVDIYGSQKLVGDDACPIG